MIFLFDFRQLGAFGLLLADALVYGCATVSNGLAEGWASRAAEEKTDFSTEASDRQRRRTHRVVGSFEVDWWGDRRTGRI